MPSHLLQRASLLYLATIAVGVWGYAVGAHHVFPYEIVHGTYTELRSFLRGGAGEQKSTLDILTMHIQEQRNRYDYGGFVQRDPDFTDPGFLLLPRWSKPDDQVIVELVKLRDFSVSHRWKPDLEEIARRGREDRPEVKVPHHKAGLRMHHPVLLSDGGLVFNLGHGALARINRNGEIVWVRGGLFHHSVELDAEQRIHAVTEIIPASENSPPGLTDDGYAVISPSGEMLEQHSLAGILRENGYDWLLMGMGRVDPKDLVHLNDVQPVLSDAGELRQGDLLLSLRDRSSIVHYRPAERRVIRVKSGPWTLQHDPDVLPDGRIAVFDNAAYLAPDGKYKRARPLASVVIWDPADDSAERPFEQAIKAADVFTTSGGQVQVLGNGDALLDESVWRRVLRVSPEGGVRWEFVNADPEDPERAAMIYWARYVEQDDPRLAWLP
ncbi:MAG: arylsulfotransferase family protein [Gammaproteobacteria bacterium]